METENTHESKNPNPKRKYVNDLTINWRNNLEYESVVPNFIEQIVKSRSKHVNYSVCTIHYRTF